MEGGNKEIEVDVPCNKMMNPYEMRMFNPWRTKVNTILNR